MRWPRVLRRHRCPPGIQLVITVDGTELVNLDSESLAYIAKYGDPGQDLLESLLVPAGTATPGRVRVMVTYRPAGGPP